MTAEYSMLATVNFICSCQWLQKFRVAFKPRDPTKLGPFRLIHCTKQYLLQKGRAAEEMVLKRAGVRCRDGAARGLMCRGEDEKRLEEWQESNA